MKLAAEKQLSQPKVVDVVEIQTDKSSVGKIFKQDAKHITGYFEKLTTEEIDAIEKSLKESGFVPKQLNTVHKNYLNYQQTFFQTKETKLKSPSRRRHLKLKRVS